MPHQLQILYINQLFCTFFWKPARWNQCRSSVLSVYSYRACMDSCTSLYVIQSYRNLHAVYLVGYTYHCKIRIYYTARASIESGYTCMVTPLHVRYGIVAYEICMLYTWIV